MKKIHLVHFFIILSFGRILCQSGFPISDGFDYPIGNGGFDEFNYPIPVPEQISNECNGLYPNNPTDPLVRTQYSTAGWYNHSDVGNEIVGAGIHPGEDWNYNSGCNDAGKEIYSVSSGRVLHIREANISQGYLYAGWTIVIKHELPTGSNIYSIYTHVTTASEPEGDVCSNESDFTISEGDDVSRGQIIARIARGNTCSGGTNMTAVSSHLHFEMRDSRYTESLDIYQYDEGNGYYDASNPSEGFLNMELEGIIDPSDFIDNHRSGKLNDSQAIFGGDVNNPKNLHLTFWNSGSNLTPLSVQIIDGTQSVSLNYITLNNLGGGLYSADVQIEGSNPYSGTIENCMKYDISLLIQDNSTDQVIEYFGKNQINFLGPDCVSYNGTTESFQGRYSKLFMDIGYKRGLITGASYYDFECGNLGIDNLLSRETAIILLYKLAKYIGAVGPINMDVNIGSYDDLTYCDPSFPIAQTFRNLNSEYTFDLNDDNMFRPNDNIQYSEYCNWLSKVFDIQENCSLFNCQASPNYNCDPSNPDWANSVSTLENTYITYDDKIIAIGKLTKWGETSDCLEYLTVSQAMRLATLILLYQFDQSHDLHMTQSNSRSEENPYEFWNVIGNQANSNYTGDQGPSSPVVFNTTIYDDEVWTSGQGPLTDQNGHQLQYYWSIIGGFLAPLLPDNNMVSWTPPNVSQDSIFKLYVWLENDIGNYADAFFNITVKDAESIDQFDIPLQCFDIIYSEYYYLCGEQTLYETTGKQYRYDGRDCDPAITNTVDTDSNTGGGTFGSGGSSAGPGTPGNNTTTTVSSGSNVPVISENDECLDCLHDLLDKVKSIDQN